MKLKTIIGSTLAVVLLGLGMLVGSVLGASLAAAQTPLAPAAAPAAQTAPTSPGTTAPAAAPTAQTAPAAPGTTAPGAIQATITQQQAEQAALAASPGNTVDHTRLGDENGTPAYDVDFTNGGGVIV